MSYVCKVCKLEFFSQSYGGPDICPSCDCGIDPKLRQAQTEVLHLTKQSAADKAEIERLRGEVAGLRKDAERYRWLRDESRTKPDSEYYIGVDSVRHKGYWSLFGDKADAIIDAAIEGERK